ncbi:MAG: general secretion pathway protein GspB [Xanthomonadaceae bacterium]|nr:general secretion pathway protein GspB [Xanthomonadaceae bacterium]
MSFILEALRRSEKERRRLESDDGSPLLPPGEQPRRRWLPWLLAGLLSLNLAALAWLLLRQPTPDPDPAPAVAAAPDTASARLADLAGQPAAPAAKPAPTTALPPAPLQPTVVAAPEPEPPWLFELSEEFRQALPSFQVGMHVYARQPQARFVLVDERTVREGQEIAPGLQLLEITPRGLILGFRGQRFQVPLQ